ncbi:DedA family protein [Candidatus Nitrosocosmicus franklandus]|uniref:SNARE associated Golgi protein n=1 Tax=Candidatus Nitrosocosmicus franklandianus TaxID=1798806 RepID=A0A484IFG0_9ARCH|nr:VTT domain-containing protein [Candidatus Nitrosocosmicus franklandus]VFJ13724.1 SNARE associated Golgi protein [Candidatus Nitrosocosmicus franklandus]
MIDIQDLYSFYSGSGYIGIFLISFIGSIIPFIPVPYFPVLVTSGLDKSLDPNLIILLSAIGAVMAKTIIFIASYYGRNILSKKTKTRMLPLQKLLSKYGGIGVFVAALTPIPDDLVYIPLGIAKYSPSRFAFFTFIGKFLMGAIIVWGTVYLGRPIMEGFLTMTDSNDQYSAILIAVLSVILLVLVLFFAFKFDWAKIIGKWFPWALDNSDTESDHDNNKNKK